MKTKFTPHYFWRACLLSQLDEARKAQSFRKASIAAGVLRRMTVNHGEQLFPIVFDPQINCFVVDRLTVGGCNTPLANAPYFRYFRFS